MKIKELFKIVNKLRKTDGCIIITKLSYGASATRYGNMTNEDIEKYTKGFDNGGC